MDPNPQSPASQAGPNDDETAVIPAARPIVIAPTPSASPAVGPSRLAAALPPEQLARASMPTARYSREALLTTEKIDRSKVLPRPAPAPPPADDGDTIDEDRFEQDALERGGPTAMMQSVRDRATDRHQIIPTRDEEHRERPRYNRLLVIGAVAALTLAVAAVAWILLG